MPFGDIAITQFVEIDTIGGKEYILPQATPAALREIEWLCPRFADEGGLKTEVVLDPRGRAGTAKALGLRIPETFLSLADEVIE